MDFVGKLGKLWSQHFEKYNDEKMRRTNRTNATRKKQIELTDSMLRFTSLALASPFSERKQK